jgi:hypothetical protein
MNVGDYTRGNGGGRRPDYIVKVGLRGEKFHRRVGAGWKNSAGGLNIKLDPGIALVSGTDVSITIWKNDERQAQPTNQPWGE